MKKTTLLLILGACLMPTAAYAQVDTTDNSSAKGHSIAFTRVSMVDKKIFQEAKQEGPHDIPVPTFMLKTKNNAFMMTIGGQVNTIMGWDIGNNLYKTDAGISFITQDIPVPAVPHHKSDFYINPLNAAIDFQVVGFAGTPNQISGYIKLQTNGNNNNISLSRAYLTWRNFTIGEKLTLFQDCYACQPPTIDPEGPSGCVSTVVYEIGYRSKNYSGFQFSLGLDMPSYYSSNGYYRGKDYPQFDGQQVSSNFADAEQLVPDIPMWVQYTSPTNSNNRVRVSGIIRNFAYRDLLADKTRHTVGWGVMLSGNLNPVKPLILYVQAAYGQGIGAYLQDIAGMPLSFIPDNAKPGKMKASPMMGLNIGATINFNSKWQFNIMASESRIWKVADYATVAADDCNYKYALYGAANIFYNVTSYLQFGVEYLYGKRMTWNMGSGHDNRIQTQIMFTL